MTTQEQIKQQIITLLDAIPAERLEEVADFVEFLYIKHTSRQTRYAPVALGGLWPDVAISDEDVAEVRQDMWHGLGEWDQ